METLSLRQVRRLALARAGLLKPEWTGLPRRTGGAGRSARRTAHRIIDRFGYLQLDTVAVAGARSHAIVLLSRLGGFDPETAESLLQPGEPLFEYWGHEASWIPLALYPAFAFRREAFRRHPWWGDLIGEHPDVAANLTRRIREEGPLRSLDMEGRGSRGWWTLKLVKRVATALWSAGILAVRERANFQRVYDLAERVIPAPWRDRDMAKEDAFEHLLLRALAGHGWAATGTLAQTWRLHNARGDILAALKRLAAKAAVVPCALVDEGGRRRPGWVRPQDLALADRLEGVRPRKDNGILLSPFDPLLWDRPRVKLLFGFDQVLEIFKPAGQRLYGYYCLPVLAGEHLVARLDLKADRRHGRLQIRSAHYEAENANPRASAAQRKAVHSALARYADAVGLKPSGPAV
jgi:uncharacterized protein YcaQ